MRVALTRELTPALARCELTHLERRPIDLDRARRQHAAYEAALREAGYAVERLPAGDDLPDSVFVEDTAVVFDELAVLARPGAASRRAEVHAVAGALAPYRELRRIEPPATLDGGDVLVVGRRVWVGQSTRTNRHALDQLRAIVGPHGYAVEGVEVRGCLHLKSAVTAVADDLLLVNRDWIVFVDQPALAAIDVDPAEPFAANALRIGSVVLYPAMFPRTRQRLRERALAVREIDVDEIAKAEGGLTCCSLIVEAG